MKLHLPKRLLTALLAAFTAITLAMPRVAYGLEISGSGEGKTTITLNANQSYYGAAFEYSVDANGIGTSSSLTTKDNSEIDNDYVQLTFTLKHTAFDNVVCDQGRDSAKIIWVTNSDPTTWGMAAHNADDSDSRYEMRGLWGADEWSDTTVIDITGDELTTYTIKVGECGTFLDKGDTISNNPIYNKSNLKSSGDNKRLKSVSLNSAFIETFNVEEYTNLTFSTETWSSTYNVEQVNNAASTMLTIDSSNAEKVCNDNYDIIAGGHGYLKISAEAADNIVLGNTVYLAESATVDNASITINNAGAVNLSGNMYLVENATIASTGAGNITISGTVTDKNVPTDTEGTNANGAYTLSLSGAGYNFTGEVNVTGMHLSEGANITLSAPIHTIGVLSADAGTIILGENSILQLGNGSSASNHTIGTLEARGGSKLQLTSNATLNTLNIASGSSITLSGSGIYKLATNTNTLTSGVTLGGDWTGVVLVSDYSSKSGGASGVQLSSITGATGLINATSSKVGLSNVVAWLGNNNISQKLHLINKDKETSALYLHNGSSNTTGTFSGDISGDGDISFTWNGGNTNTAPIGHTFTGNTSNWDGWFISSKENTGKRVQVSFTRTGDVFSAYGNGGVKDDHTNDSKLEVVVGNSSNESTNITFNGSILNAKQLDVYDTVTFKKTIEATTFNLNGTANVTLGDGTSVVSATVGTLNASTGSVTVKSNATFEVNTATIHSLTSGGTVLIGSLGNVDDPITLTGGSFTVTEWSVSKTHDFSISGENTVTINNVHLAADHDLEALEGTTSYCTHTWQGTEQSEDGNGYVVQSGDFYLFKGLKWSGSVEGTAAVKTDNEGNTIVTISKTGEGKFYIYNDATYTDASILGSHGVYLTQGKTLDLAIADTQTLSTVLEGTGSLKKTGSGTLTLSGANTYTGATYVEEGMLVVSKGNASSSSYDISENATLKVNTFSGSWDKTITGNGTLSMVIAETTNHGNNLTGIGGFTGVLEISKAVGSRGNTNLTAYSLAKGASLRLVSGNNWSDSTSGSILITQDIELAGKTKEDFMFLHENGKTLELSGVVTGTYLTSGESYNGYYNAQNHYNNLTLSGANSRIEHVFMFESSTLTVNADMFFGTVTAATVVIGEGDMLTLGGGTAETPVEHNIAKLSAASGSLSLGDYATLTLGGGTAEAPVEHNIAKLSAASGSLSLGDYATLKITEVPAALKSLYSEGNNDASSSVSLTITGGTGSVLDLAMSATDDWQKNNTVTLSQGENSDLAVRISSGYLANSVFGPNTYAVYGDYATTNLGGSALSMANLTMLVLRKGNSAENFGAGDITLEGTTNLRVYGSVSKDNTRLTNNISGDTLNITNGTEDGSDGGITLTGNLNLTKLSNQARKEVVLSGESMQFGTLEVKSSNGSTTTISGNATADSVSVQQGTLKLGATATISKAEGKDAASMQNVKLSEEGIASADETKATKGSVTDAKVTLAALAEGTSFSIEDVTLTNVNIEAENADDRVNLSGVSATDVQLTKGEFHMLDKAQPQVGTGGSVEGVPTGLQFSTSLLNGMTLGADASMVVDLGDLSGFTGMDSGKPTFSITLEGFRISEFNINDYLAKNSGIYFAADSWLGQLLVAQGAWQYVKGDTLEAGAQAAAGSGSGVSVRYYNSTSSVGTVIIISGLQVPEPATSTLGLIALTALVSRRRRK